MVSVPIALSREGGQHKAGEGEGRGRSRCRTSLWTVSKIFTSETKDILALVAADWGQSLLF